jgi:putative transcriptional regulator
MMKISDKTLKNNFLISMPALQSDQYKNALIYVCHQSEYGSMGIIINQEYSMDLATMLNHLQITCIASSATQNIFYGGDTQNDRGFILHPYCEQDSWLSSYQVSEALSLTSSTDILEAIAVGQGPKQSLVALGYISWGPGELENEFIDNFWLNCPANLDIIFNIAAPEKMQAAATLIGIKLDALISYSGQA